MHSSDLDDTVSYSRAPQRFTIVKNTDQGFHSFNRKVEVFGVPIYAVPQVSEDRLLHAANVMAQYLDNDADGIVDNPTVLRAMHDNHAVMVMWKKASDLDAIVLPDNTVGQDLGNDETLPAWHTNERQGRFDASLEEVWHIISHAGYASAYPEVFGEQSGSELAKAMDKARGDLFIEIPASYPEGAWYTYDDQTCDYSCMVAEYFYWALTSLLGAHESRSEEINDEWRLNTPELLRKGDTAVLKLLTHPEYKLPTVLPDGVYSPEQPS